MKPGIFFKNVKFQFHPLQFLELHFSEFYFQVIYINMMRVKCYVRSKITCQSNKSQTEWLDNYNNSY